VILRQNFISCRYHSEKKMQVLHWENILVYVLPKLTLMKFAIFAVSAVGFTQIFLGLLSLHCCR
jgi:hypothetical protein